MIPQDDLMMAQIASQLNGKLSTETILSNLSFVDNVQNEMSKIQNDPINIGNEVLNNSGGGANG
jgi:hypothetical protein